MIIWLIILMSFFGVSLPVRGEGGYFDELRREVGEDAELRVSTHETFSAYFRTSFFEKPSGMRNKPFDRKNLDRCESWRKTSLARYANRVSQIKDCHQQGGVCDHDHRKGCLTDYETEVEFKAPQTYFTLVKRFQDASLKASFGACQRWVYVRAKFMGNASCMRCVQRSTGLRSGRLSKGG